MRAAVRRPSARSVARAKRRALVLLRRLVVVGIVVAAALVVTLFLARRPVPVASVVPMASPHIEPYASNFVQAGAPWSSADTAKLSGAVSPIVNGPYFPASAAAIFADARTGRILYEHNAHAPLVPASTIKLIVAAAALHYLGPDYRFKTSIASDAPVRDGVLEGNLYLIGGGDPALSSADLRAAVHRLQSRGVRSIAGDVVADGSLYGADSVNRTWDPNDLQYGWAAPPSALTIDNGAVQFTIVPDPGGGLAAVHIDPISAAGRLVGGVRTAGEGDENTLRIDPLPDASGFSISGQIPYGAPQKYWRSIEHPTEVAASVLRALLEQGGIRVLGAAVAAEAPSDPTMFWVHRSPPLTAIIHKMTFDSDNHIAEQLLRAVGAKASGRGTLHNGLAAERAFLASLREDDRKMTLADGCGLSPGNKITVASLAAVLRSMLRGPDAATDAALLPRLGMEGTVQSRALPEDAAGRVLGKDGYIDGASGLAGFVKTAHHGIVIYAFLVDNWNSGLDAVWSGENEVLTRIARF